MGAKLDSSDVGVLAARDNVLQHLPLAALAVGVQQVHGPIEELGNIFNFFRSSSDLQFFKLFGQILRIHHSKSSLPLLVGFSQFYYSRAKINEYDINQLMPHFNILNVLKIYLVSAPRPN